MDILYGYDIYCKYCNNDDNGPTSPHIPNVIYYLLFTGVGVLCIV